MIPERIVPAKNMIWHNGFVDNFDQARGISPLSSALNTMRDLHENFDYALSRAKISQLFAFAITRDIAALEQEADGGYGNYKNAKTGVDLDDETVADQDDSPEYDVDFGKGSVFLDMEPGHDAKFLESQQPSDQFREFTMTMLQLAMKSLDIPFSFYSENFTNFFGSRAALQHYERSCLDRRETLQGILDEITRYMIMTWILNGDIELPRGMKLSDLIWEWVADGIPWWDPAKEIKGDVMAIGAGLDTPQRICKERGRGDFFENIDEIAKAREYAASKGVPVSFSTKKKKDKANDTNND
jgi:capsid protein